MKLACVPLMHRSGPSSLEQHASRGGRKTALLKDMLTTYGQKRPLRFPIGSRADLKSHSGVKSVVIIFYFPASFAAFSIQLPMLL